MTASVEQPKNSMHSQLALNSASNLSPPPLHLSFVSLGGVISLLEEKQLEVCSQAINQLLNLVDYFWFEVGDAIPRLEQLTGLLPNPLPVWLLLSKVYFHLGEYGKSVYAALQAGDLFNLNEGSPFVQTIVAKAIDQYIAARGGYTDGDKGPLDVEPALENLVSRMISQCLQQGQVVHVIGIAIESRRLDVLKAVLETNSRLMYYARKIATKHVSNLDYQREILSLIATIAFDNAKPDFIFVVDCLVAMDDAAGCNALLLRLIKALDPDASSPAEYEHQVGSLYQIAFNISSDASQHFISSVIEAIENAKCDKVPKSLITLLSGSVSTELQLDFLCRNNLADMAIMEKTKESLNAHNSMHHSVLSCANAIMHCGTTNDEFMRKNLDWLSYASNWAKFTAAASLGVVHKGQQGRGQEILEPYLPVAGEKNGSAYAEGGALFALGLMNARQGNNGNDIPFLMAELDTSSNRSDADIRFHGAALGLGAAAMSSASLNHVDLLKAILYRDDASSGEAAAISIGLVMHGTGSLEVVNELLLYSGETQHEKVQRGIVLCTALIFSGLREKANNVIRQLLDSSNPTLRFGAVWTTALAFAGSGDNGAVARLLHVAVSDADEDVCRSAVMALGFVLCRNPEELPRIVELMTESYNPHVRYGAAMALGIAFAGSGNKAVIELIKPMCKDFTDFVRQGAYISLAMIMMLHNDITCDEVSWARGLFESVISIKHEDAMAKFGAVLAQGIIDAGGRSSLLSLLSPTGHVDHMAAAGAMLFCQFWYWYPLTNFISLALRPAALIGVDCNLRRPKFEVICKAKPSRFAVPPPVKDTVAAAPKKLVTAILSTTAKAAARARKSARSTDNMMEVEGARSISRGATPASAIADASMEIDDKPSKSSNAAADDDMKYIEDKEEATGSNTTAPASETLEQDTFMLRNFSRVTPTQLNLIEFPSDGKYKPLGGEWDGGIVVLTDLKPSVPAEYLIFEPIKAETKSPSLPAAAAAGTSQLTPPAPFVIPDELKEYYNSN